MTADDRDPTFEEWRAEARSDFAFLLRISAMSSAAAVGLWLLGSDSTWWVSAALGASATVGTAIAGWCAYGPRKRWGGHQARRPVPA